MIGADIKTVVFWKLSITMNIYQPLLAERFIFLFRRNLIKTYINIICRSICTTDSGAAHHLQNQIYERVWSLIIRDISNLRLEEITFNRENVNNHYDQRLKILVSRNVLHENYVTCPSLLSRQGARFLSGESMTLESKRNMFKAIWLCKTYFFLI